jgi:isoquinoline 1-oxidoreductase beta subunit
VSQFKLIGKPAKRVDTAAKVNGTARFGIDTMVEGMRVAAIAMCPTIGGRLRSLDERASHALPGVVDILRIDDAVAVVGENYWTAKRGLDLLKIEWDEGPHAALTSATLAESLRSAQGTPINGSLTGDPDRVIQEAGKQRIEATYDLPYLAQTVAGRIRGPVGLDIGAKTPAGIALAIVAQIHAVLGLREGSPIEVATC